MSERVPLCTPLIGESEAAYVAECIASGYVSSVGPFVRRFEEEFAAAVGARYAVACASGTAALHVAMRLLGVGRGDEVAVSDFTFIASANAAVYEGARPLLVDSEERTWALDVYLLAEELAARSRAGRPLPKAIEVVHQLGQPADTAPLLELADRYGIPVVEDAAEALGATFSTGPLAGRSVGTVGRLGAFSFNGNKIITTGGGGMLVTDDAALADRARHLTTQARLPDVGYLHDEVGYNYRLTNVAAALGVAQLERLEGFVAAKRRIAARYDAGLAGTGVTCPPRVPGLDSTYWLYSVLVPEEAGAAGRDLLLARLDEAGVDARALWRPLHQQPPFAGYPALGGRVGEQLFRRGVSLPSSVHLTDEQQDRVIEVVRAVAAQGW